MNRLAKGEIREVIMGTNPNLEGDGTALHLQNIVARDFRMCRSRGLLAGCRRGAASNTRIGIFWRMRSVGGRGCKATGVRAKAHTPMG